MDIARALDKAIKVSSFDVNKTISLLKSQNVSVNNVDVTQRIKTLETYQKQLKKLLKVPKIEQKTEEWYKARENMISASDFAQALGFGKFGTSNQLIQKKCDPPNEAAFSLSNQFFKWGNMFESVAIDIYSHMNSVTVHSFGLLKHPKHNFLGASPDGISDLGIMVEIKCPLKRKITGDIPTQYYYQIQGQLDVCNLTECDYFECEFATFNSYTDFEKGISDHEYTGIVIDMCDTGKCIYSPILYGDSKESIKKAKIFMEENSKIEGKYNILYWYLVKSNTKRVVKDQKFLKEKIKDLESVWQKILFYRSNREQYVMDILNTIDIDTEVLYENKKQCTRQQTPTIKGYSLQDMAD